MKLENIKDIKFVLLDFGGVVAEEGFKEGLKAIAKKFRLDPNFFFEIANGTVYGTGYVTGNADEKDFWDALKTQTGIYGQDRDLREEILKRFIIRPGMLEIVDDIRSKGIPVGILSDQTDWLDILEERHHFFSHFDIIFNSFHLGKSKKEPSFFDEAAKSLGVENHNILFADDNMGNIERARSKGFMVHLYTDEETFKDALSMES